MYHVVLSSCYFNAGLNSKQAHLDVARPLHRSASYEKWHFRPPGIPEFPCARKCRFYWRQVCTKCKSAFDLAKFPPIEADRLQKCSCRKLIGTDVDFKTEMKCTFTFEPPFSGIFDEVRMHFCICPPERASTLLVGCIYPSSKGASTV